MAKADDDDNDALLEQLSPRTGGAPTSNTMPVPPPATAAPPAAATDPRDPSRTSANAPRVVQNAAGGWDLTEHGNTRNLQGNEVDDARNYANQFWKDNPTGFQMNNPLTIPDAYQQFTGRAPDAAGMAAHAGNPGGTAGVVNTIMNSDEAKAYAAKSAPPITSTMTGGTATPPATTPPATAPAGTTTPGQVVPQQLPNFTPKHAMEGFPTNRPYDTGKSAKDAFAVLANNAPPPPLNDKAALGAWFKQYIEPGMNQLGHKVNSVNGDVFNFSNWQGTFDVDYGRGAGAPGGALAWQVQEPTAKLSGGAYKPAATTAAPAAVPATTPAANTSAQAKLQAELDALINGKPAPTDNDALLQQLQ